MSKMVKGYKVFNSDWTCRGFQYEVGKTYTLEGKPEICVNGFHFCENLVDCFNYYKFDPNNKVAEIRAYNTILNNGKDKSCTNKIKIMKELSWAEVLRMVNSGDFNSGYRNSGDFNSGDFNSGDFNSGYRNSGDFNSGNFNSGNCNSGDFNSGYRNSGNRNSGNFNSGNFNSGDFNSGNFNSGDFNSGYFNSGDRNSGNRNSGNFNSGNFNSGDFNSGYFNSGDFNSGDFNSINNSSGCFNTEETTIRFFNKESNWTYKDWEMSNARRLLLDMPQSEFVWIDYTRMTDEEKTAHPEAEVTVGYLKKMDSDVQKWWNELAENDKNEIKAIPNFDADIFRQCTGIGINK